jgi:5-methylthioadenosine/S-adenosylhomocysteine deaminase
MTTLKITDGSVLLPDMTVERADVLIDQDAGTIQSVGTVEPADETLDAEGGLVIPGLVNAHCHAAMTLFRGYADDKPLDAWLQEDIWPAEAELEPADVRAGTKLAVVEMLKSGTTAFADMYFDMGEVAEVVRKSGMRALLGYGAISVAKDEGEAHEEMQHSLSFAAEFQGAADGRIRTAFMPHSLTTVDEEYYREYVPKARDLGVPVHLHANETKNEVEPIVDERGERPIEYADDMGVLGDEDFLAHGVHLDDTEIEILAERGTSVIHCPASNMKLASGMAPVQDMLDAGVNVGLGTDGAASNNDLDLFDEIRDAAMVGKLAADDASAVAAEDAFSLATKGSADALGFDSGRIESGANADLAVLDLDAAHLTPAHDLVSHLAYAASGSDVRHTICDGRVLVDDREVVPFDEDAVKQDAAEHAAAVVERAE